MLQIAVAFLVLSLIAALFGFFGLASGVATMARTLFLVLLIGFLLTFVLGLLTGKNGERSSRE